MLPFQSQFLCRKPRCMQRLLPQCLGIRVLCTSTTKGGTTERGLSSQCNHLWILSLDLFAIIFGSPCVPCANARAHLSKSVKERFFLLQSFGRPGNHMCVQKKKRNSDDTLTRNSTVAFAHIITYTQIPTRSLSSAMRTRENSLVLSNVTEK